MIPLSIYIVTLFIAFIGLCIWWVLYKWSSAKVSSDRACRECGYKLFGEELQRCPECGSENAERGTINHHNSGRTLAGYIGDLVLVASIGFAVYVFSAGLINDVLPKSWRALYYGTITGGPEGRILMRFSASSESVSENDKAYEAFMANMIAMPVDISVWVSRDNKDFRVHLVRETAQDSWKIVEFTSQKYQVDSEAVVTPTMLVELIEDQPAIEVPFDSESMVVAFEAMLTSEWSTGEFQSALMAYPDSYQPLANGLFVSRPYVGGVSGQNVTADRRVLLALIIVLILSVITVALLWHRRYHAKKN
ncbi:MAG: zinc ribbon domain-containing protein [Phycisphaerales bacterium]|nr:zinc ribbon domain-containing protein [Phycisphaerales bacterium]